MILNQLDSLHWSFFVRNKDPFTEFEFKTTSLLALLQIIYPDISPKRGYLSPTLFERNDLFGACQISNNPLIISFLKFNCIQILKKKSIPDNWDSLLNNFICTNCVHFSIIGSVTKQERFYQLSLDILFSNFITHDFKVSYYAQKFKQ